jgi:hypothetical protein
MSQTGFSQYENAIQNDSKVNYFIVKTTLKIAESKIMSNFAP